VASRKNSALAATLEHGSIIDPGRYGNSEVGHLLHTLSIGAQVSLAHVSSESPSISQLFLFCNLPIIHCLDLVVMPPERTTRRCLRTGRPKRVKIEPSVSSESSGEDIPFAPSSEASVRSEASATALDPDSDDNDGDNVSEATVLTSTRPGGISHQQKTIKRELWELLDSWLNKNPGEMPPCALRADYNPINTL
jgi:hypothetical protein